jgi:predicted nucleic acid-binding protein
MSAYFDSAYLAKCYLVDPESNKVRELVKRIQQVYSSALCIAEVSCALHRSIRERTITRDEASHLRTTFLLDVSTGTMKMIPVTDVILRTVEATVAKMPDTVFLRASDAIHLASAQLEGFAEIWTNDRHMLKAANHFGLTGRSI